MLHVNSWILLGFSKAEKEWRGKMEVGKEGDGGGGRAWAMAMMALEDLYVCLRTVEPSGGGVRGVARGEGGVWRGAVH